MYADFNDDGLTDIAVVTSGSLTVSLNRGSRVFVPLATVRVSFPNDFAQSFPPPLLVAATDVNRDGHTDLVLRGTATLASTPNGLVPGQNILVLPGRGDGTFGAGIDSVVRAADGWNLIDFDHDGLLDFVDATYSPNAITFNRSNGDGTFSQSGVPFSAAKVPNGASIETGDFDGDGRVDSFYEFDWTNDRVTLAFGWNETGSGITSVASQLYVGSLPFHVKAIDVDGYGVPALVGVHNETVSIMRARNRQLTIDKIAAPGLRDAPALNGTFLIGSVAATDFDGDGLRDVVIASGGTLAILWRNRDGSFATPVTVALAGSSRVAVTDLDGDGRPELVSPGDFLLGNTSAENTLWMVSANGRNLVPSAPRNLLGGLVASAIGTADVNGDGAPDLLMSGESVPDIRVFLGDGHGEFARGSLITSPTFHDNGGFAAADVDADGRVDLIIGTFDPHNAPKIRVLFGDGSGSFEPGVELDGRLTGIVEMKTEHPAILIVNGPSRQLVSISSGRVVQSMTLDTRAELDSEFIVDVDGDGQSEIIERDRDANAGYLLTRSGPKWDKRLVLAALAETKWIGAADLDNDGKREVVIDSDSLAIYRTAADGPFVKAADLYQKTAGFGFSRGVALADLDRDGLTDIVINTGTYVDGPTIVVLRNSGNLQFAITQFARTPDAHSATLLDVDGDGWLDVVLPARGSGAVIYRNICAEPEFRVTARSSVIAAGARATIAIENLGFAGSGNNRISIDGGAPVDVEGSEWTSPPLSRGLHTFTVLHRDPYGGEPTSLTLTVQAGTPDRRRSSRH